MVIKKESWESRVLILAGLYNLLWGFWVIFYPAKSLKVFGIVFSQYIEIWQCVGMIVGVYGVGYLIASREPYRHWPIIFVGLLGKVLGPIGFIDALQRGVFPLEFGLNIIFNDLIWWVPFFLILKRKFKKPNISQMVKIAEHDFMNFSKTKKAHFINSLSGFKPLNLIATISREKYSNVCVISSLFHLGSDPALMGFIIKSDLELSHTLNNLRFNRMCTINHVNEEIFRKAHQTSARYALEQSEFTECGLTEKFLDDFPVPFVGESNLCMSLEMLSEKKLEENGAHLVILRVKDVYLPRDLITDNGFINIEAAGTICVSGLDSYHRTDFIERLCYAR